MESMDGKDLKVSSQALFTAPNCLIMAYHLILRASHALSADRCSSVVCKLAEISHHAACAACVSIDERQRAI